jgi:hypothetical protein
MVVKERCLLVVFYGLIIFFGAVFVKGMVTLLMSMPNLVMSMVFLLGALL